MRDLKIYDFKRALPRMVYHFIFYDKPADCHTRRAGRGRTSTTSGGARSASLQKIPTLQAPQSRYSSSVGLQSASFVPIMATSLTRILSSVGICPLPSRTCVQDGDRRKTTPLSSTNGRNYRKLLTKMQNLGDKRLMGRTK